MAVVSARRAGEGVWKRSCRVSAAASCRKRADRIREHGERLAIAEVLDSGKTISEARGDVAGAARASTTTPARRTRTRGGAFRSGEGLRLVLDQRAGRRHRAYHPLELSAFDHRPQRRAGACRRLHRRGETRRTDADDGADAGGTAAYGRPAGRRLQCRDRHGGGGRRAAGRHIPMSATSPSRARP